MDVYKAKFISFREKLMKKRIESVFWRGSPFPPPHILFQRKAHEKED